MIRQAKRLCYRSMCACAIGLLSTWCCPANAFEPDLQAIDKNENGVIEPAEIPVRDLTVISRYASLVGLEIDQAMPIPALERGRNRYLDSLDGGSEELRLAGKREFGRLRQSTVRPFGNVGNFVDSYTSGVRKGTIVTFQKFDANRDGLLTREELSVSYRYYGQLWMRGDRDGNGVLTFSELAESIAADGVRRYTVGVEQQEIEVVDGVSITPAHRREADRLMSKFDRNKNRRLENSEVPPEWKSGNFLGLADRDEDGQITRDEMQFGAARAAADNQLAQQRKQDPNLDHCVTLAADLVRRFDLNKDRTLHSWEWQRIGGDISAGDLNGNGMIIESELAQWLLTRLSAQAASSLPTETPSWYLESDRDADRQVTQAEFVAARSADLLFEFEYYDRNSDGMVTADELGRRGAGKSRYASSSPRVLEARHEIEAEIYVADAVTIADIDVHVSIVKNGDDDLELRLIGPDDTTAVLYYTGSRKAWGGGSIFRDTIIDDEAPTSSQRLPRPPAHRSFRPQSIGRNDMASLKAFYGKPAKGRWRLVVGNNARYDGGSAGLLQGWALLIEPEPLD